jgi:hypothetical protein
VNAATEQYSLSVLTSIGTAFNAATTLDDSMDSIVSQEIAALNASNAEAYATYTAAWNAANGDSTLRQAAASAFMTASQTAVDLANTNLNAALAITLPTINAIRTTMATTVNSAANTLDVAMQAAISVFAGTESAAWQSFLSGINTPPDQVHVQQRYALPELLANQTGPGLLPPSTTPPVAQPPILSNMPGPFKLVPDPVYNWDPIDLSNWIVPPPTALTPNPTVNFRQPVIGTALLPIKIDAGPGKLIILDPKLIKINDQISKITLEAGLSYNLRVGNTEFTLGSGGGYIDITNGNFKIVPQPGFLKIVISY